MGNSEAIAQFRSQFRGEIIEPEDPRYADSRKVYNAMIDRKPGLIAQCADVADVMTAVRFGRDNGMLVSIRGGGHNAGGLGICDGGLVIDLSPIRYVHVDPASRTVRVGGGCRWSDVDHATHAFGLAVPSGIVGSTGVGGLSLGGGLGHVCAGPILWEMADAADIMKWYREFIVQAPEEINGFFAFLTVPPGPPFPEHLHMKKMCGIVWCYTGSPEQANQILEPMRSFRRPAFEFFVPMPFPMLNGMFDGLYPPGLQWYWKADFFKELTDEAIARHVQHGAKLPTMHSTMHLYPINGAAHKVGNHETPWSYRDAVWSEVIVGVDPDPANRERITGWAKDYYDALHPFGAGGAYVNFMMEEGEDRIRATYRGNYDRLAAIKAKYDPKNFFRVNQNIKPAS